MTNAFQLDRRGFLGLGAAASLVAALSACSSGDAKTTPATAGAQGGADSVITAGISYELGTNGYDPMKTSSALTVAANWHTMEGLTDLNPATREVYPALGADLPKKVDDTTYEVTLREGAVFHDGSKVTADDVVFSFARDLFRAEGTPRLQGGQH
ncbi:MAG: ABC transporter substrate-binding protein, partial [Propionibacteriaceae bacterium]|nr:ABC transporter substrate-binding protein [Propionibacteriaceae bacterium]